MCKTYSTVCRSMYLLRQVECCVRLIWKKKQRHPQFLLFCTFRFPEPDQLFYNVNRVSGSMTWNWYERYLGSIYSSEMATNVTRGLRMSTFHKNNRATGNIMRHVHLLCAQSCLITALWITSVCMWHIKTEQSRLSTNGWIHTHSTLHKAQ